MKDLNAVIHQPSRLRIMAALVGVEKDMRVDFNYLRDSLHLTEGNLSTHLQKLEESGLIKIEKEFIDKRPRTWVSLSATGRDTFREYISVLEGILSGNRDKE